MKKKGNTQLKKELKFLEQVFDFWIVGLIGTVIHLGLLFLLTNYFQVYYLISGIISFTIATFYSFISNKHFTFHSKLNVIICEERFFAVSFVALVINSVLLYLLTSVFHIYYLISQLIVGLIIFTLTFFAHKYWSFKK